MKVLFCPAHYVFDEYYGGSEMYAAFCIADRLARKNSGSAVIAGASRLLSEKPYRILEVKQNASRDMSVRSAISFCIAYTFAGLKILRTEEFDIIHHVRPFKIGSTFNLIAVLGIAKTTPFIIGSFASPYFETYTTVDAKTSHPIKSPLKIFKKPFESLLRHLSYRTLKAADRVIVYDQYTKDLVKEIIPDQKISIIPPGKDSRAFQRPGAQQKHSGPNFLVVGYLNARKNAASIIRAFSHVVHAIPEARLTIVGDGEERRNLELLTASLNVADSVQFAGFIENRRIPSFYFQADVFVHAAHEESFGQVYLEAMASEVPIITSNTRGARQILEHGKTAIIIDDIENLAASMIYLGKNALVRSKLARVAYKHFKENFEWNAIIQKYQKIYDEVLAEKRKATITTTSRYAKI